jgi:hypothetical protein
MANYNTPWNKGIKQPIEMLKAKQKAYYAKNKEIILKQVAQNRKNKAQQYKEYMKWYAIKKKYNLTKVEYAEMLKNQKHVCAICYKNKSLVVDHCHKTSKVRGLICDYCNIAMGIIDNAELLESAIRYKRESD